MTIAERTSMTLLIRYEDSFTQQEILDAIREKLADISRASGPAYGPQDRPVRPVPVVSVEGE